MGSGVKGAGKAAADPFLDHVVAASNQSAEVGVHPEDPAGAPGKFWGPPRSRVAWYLSASFHLLSVDRRTRLEATSCGHGGGGLALASALSHENL